LANINANVKVAGLVDATLSAEVCLASPTLFDTSDPSLQVAGKEGLLQAHATANVANIVKVCGDVDVSLLCTDAFNADHTVAGTCQHSST